MRESPMSTGPECVRSFQSALTFEQVFFVLHVICRNVLYHM